MNWVNVSLPAPFVAVVSLQRPPVNALNREVREELLETIDSLQNRNDVRVIILTSEGKIFCAGADIKEKATQNATDDSQNRANRLTKDVFFSFLESSKPIIAAVNGVAVGAGFVLASCCDVILAAESATFGMPEIDVGQGGGASFLQRILPLQTMRRMMLTGERITAAELYRLGAVERCVPDTELLAVAIELATVIAAKSPLAVKKIRESFLTIESLAINEGFRLEQGYISELSKSADAHEARQAFLEKRKPSY